MLVVLLLALQFAKIWHPNFKKLHLIMTKENVTNFIVIRTLIGKCLKISFSDVRHLLATKCHWLNVTSFTVFFKL